MGKVIFWLVIVFAVMFVLRLVNAAKARARADRARDEATRAAKEAAPMVRCVECGVFLPRADAVPAPNGFRCGERNCANRR